MPKPKHDARELTIREADELAARYPYDGNADLCDAIARAPQSPPGTRYYTCTRPAGHDGPHIAHAPKGPIATW